MKKMFRMMGMGMLVWMMGFTPLMAAAAAQPAADKDAETLSLLYAAMRARVFVQIIAKDYLYIGNDIVTTAAKKEMAFAKKKFKAQEKLLEASISDPKLTNIMAFVKMNAEDLEEELKQPYSLERAQEVIDLAEAISEGYKKIAKNLRKKLSKNYPSGKGQRYLLTQIAKYYMAYQAGIKDDNTVHQMNKAVERFDQLLKEMKAYPENTAKMNRVMNHAEKLWKIVKEFYVDLEEGGLPIIVYQTTRKIDKDIITYSRLVAPKAVVK